MPPSAASPSPSPSRRIRRSVCFAEDHNTTHILHDLCPEDQWTSQEEFEDTKKGMKRKIQEWKMKGYNVLLRNTFDNPHPTVQHNINAYSQLDERDCVRGMERSLSTNLDQKVAAVKRRCIKTVLSHQRLMKKENVSPDIMQEELAVVSKMQSRSCVLFARRLGKADELAVQNDDVSAAHKLVQDLNTMTEKLKPRATALTGMTSASAAAASAVPRSRRSPRSGREARIA